MRPTELEILVDLVLEDLDRAQPLFEGNPYRDARGKFSSKDAADAYAGGAMAAGRAAGIVARRAGKDREEVRAAIKDAMERRAAKTASNMAIARREGGGEAGAKGFQQSGREQAQSELAQARKYSPSGKVVYSDREKADRAKRERVLGAATSLVRGGASAKTVRMVVGKRKTVRDLAPRKE